MTRHASEKGFTLLEILVASMLLAMLITILTMVFNSSSIAWSTGKASVTEMDDVRLKMSAASQVADNAMPGVKADNKNSWGFLVGPWNANGGLRQRALAGNMQGENVLTLPQLSSDKGSWVYKDDRLCAVLSSLSVQNTGKAKDYVVGVWSLGPDGKANSGDDISTWPDVE